MTDSYRYVQDILKLRWVAEVVEVMAEGGSHYSSITGRIDYLSHTELNRKLAILLDRQMVVRQADGSYHLTDKGWQLYAIIQQIEIAGQQMMEKEVS